jgi:hypothetical protein
MTKGHHPGTQAFAYFDLNNLASRSSSGFRHFGTVFVNCLFLDVEPSSASMMYTHKITCRESQLAFEKKFLESQCNIIGQTKLLIYRLTDEGF